MLTVEAELAAIQAWKGAVYAACPDQEYMDKVAMPWFEHIGPERAVGYGVLGLNELGVVGVVFQVFNCYFRWRHLEDEGTGWTAMLDTLRDLLGYSVLAGVVGGVDPAASEWLSGHMWAALGAHTQYLVLKSDYGLQAERSFRLAMACFNETRERIGP